jgi:flagellar export protein FliJ
MAFRFSLAAVLLVRKNAKNREEQALHTIQLDIARVSRQVDELNADIVNTHKARERAMEQPIPAAQLHSYLHRVQSMAETRKTLLQRLHTLELDRERQMKIYQGAYRDLEMIVDMFNDQRDAHDQEQNRTEQKSLDDIFVARRQRN